MNPKCQCRCLCKGLTLPPPIHLFAKIVRAIFNPGGTMKEIVKIIAQKGGVLAVLALLLLAVAVPAAAQKNKDKKKQQQSDSASDAQNMPAVSDTQAVDLAIGQNLGYWQIGDVDSLHKYYADDVVVGTGHWSPPLIGWDDSVKCYQAERLRVM